MSAPPFVPPDSVGASLVELLLVLALVGVGLGMTWPLLASPLDASRARQAGGFLETEMRRVRQEAVSRAASVALVFDNAAGKWTFRACADGNANGVRRTDVSHGKDRCFDGPYDLSALFPGVQIAVDASLPDPDGGPGTTDPVKLGSSDMASFSATGTSSSGTVYLRSPKGAQYAVRISGVTGRTRLLKYDTGSRAWIEM
jgi:type II secretory pathway pseudopilin PulG